MNKPNLSMLFVNAKHVLTKHGPEILTGVGIAGMITTTILAVKTTPKAMRLIEEAKAEKDDKLTNVEVVKKTWKCYVPAAITGVASIACLISASSVNVKRNAALVTACKIAEASFTEFKEKVAETVGEEKTNKIIDNINKNGVPLSSSNEKRSSGKTFIFEDEYTGVVFETNMRTIDKAFSALEKNIILYDETPLTDLYWKIMEIDNRVKIDIPKIAKKSYFTYRHMVDGEIPYNIVPRFYPEKEETRLILVYEEPKYSDDEY